MNQEYQRVVFNDVDYYQNPNHMVFSTKHGTYAVFFEPDADFVPVEGTCEKRIVYKATKLHLNGEEVGDVQFINVDLAARTLNFQTIS